MVAYKYVIGYTLNMSEKIQRIVAGVSIREPLNMFPDPFASVEMGIPVFRLANKQSKLQIYDFRPRVIESARNLELHPTEEQLKRKFKEKFIERAAVSAFRSGEFVKVELREPGYDNLAQLIFGFALMSDILVMERSSELMAVPYAKDWALFAMIQD